MKHIIDIKLLKFISVGIVNTLVGMAIMFGLYNLAGCSYWLSSAANYILASILSYVLNKKFTFGHKGRVVRSAVRFTVNIALCYIIAYGVAKPVVWWFATKGSLAAGGLSLSIRENMAMIVGMCIFTGLNYIGQRFFVFAKADKNADEEKGDITVDYKTTYNKWLASPYISQEDKEQLKKMSEEEIQDAFYKRVEFGTAGMRGKMGLGTNRLNKYTIRMAAYGLARLLGEGSKVAIAYDTRNNSQSFGQEAAKVLEAYGIKALLFDRYSPVPLLSFTVRELKCDGGIVITASHNTSEYNGFKVYDDTGCQMNTEMSGKIADNIEALKDELNINAKAEASGNIEHIGQEIVDRFIERAGDIFEDAKEGQGAKAGEKALKVVYTPLHGSGRDYVLKVLDNAGFKKVSLVKEQAEFDGNFPTVKKPNPEEHEALALAAKQAVKEEADIIIGTDPDCDRIGVGVRCKDEIVYLTGNQTGALLIDYLSKTRDCAGKTLVTTIVTGELGPVIARDRGLKVKKVLTGFKYIGNLMNKMEAGEFFMGYEESYGYLVGDHARDKDGVSAALAICQMANYFGEQGLTLIDELEKLYERYGRYEDKQESFLFEGEEGEKQMGEIIAQLKTKGKDAFPEKGQAVEFIDYNWGIDGLPPANVLKYIFEDGSWTTVRPSGTEPKIKYYYCDKK